MDKKSSKMQLIMLGLPVMSNLSDFSACSRVSKDMLYCFSRHSKYYYKTYDIPKKSGGKRTISQPCYSLKALQSWILRNILDNIKESSASKGFQKNLGVLDNAKPHIGANIVITLDIDNFFPSIKASYVYNIFRTIGYNSLISSILTAICTYDGALPQGGPSSPKLANLACLRLDYRLQGYVGKKGIIYTRYADDLTFSSLAQSRALSALPTIRKIIDDEGFKLNESKFRVRGPSRTRKITGLILSDDKIGIGRNRYREIRTKINHLCLHDRDIGETKDLLHVKGWLAFIKNVDMDRYRMLSAYIAKLKDKYPNSLIALS